MKPGLPRRTRAAFTTVELVVALLLFSGATSGVLLMSKAMRDHRSAGASASERNAYATFQSEVALQGINPAVVGNPLTGAIETSGTVGTIVSLGANTTLQVTRNRLAAFEIGAVASPAGAQSNLSGSATVNAVNYAVNPSGTAATRGAGIGFAVETVGAAIQTVGIPLAPPSFNLPDDLTAAPFPLNNIATLPASNPAGTTYHYTTDGTIPTAGSPLWDNNPGWTSATFPAMVTLAAFNSDSRYLTSVAVTATFTMQLKVGFARADGRTNNLFGFTLADLGSAGATGIVLTTNVPGYGVYYTMDGSDPTTAGQLYQGAFLPVQAQFTPTILLKVMATNSSDRRIIPTAVYGYMLTALTSPLTSPTFITDNSQPLLPGSPVLLSVSGSGTPRTAVNAGAPTTSSSSATSFPLE